MASLDFSTIRPRERYKLMSALVVPRPIAWITTLSDNGVVNAAPFSFFNVVGEEPPMLMFSVSKREDGTLKDTAANVLATGEFVVHIADENLGPAMHASSAALPPDASELELTGLSTAPSVAVRPPRIAEAPVAFECKLVEQMENACRHIFFGEILNLHARDGLLDLGRYRVNLDQYFPVGRFGSTLYVRTRERFEMDATEKAR